MRLSYGTFCTESRATAPFPDRASQGSRLSTGESVLDHVDISFKCPCMRNSTSGQDIPRICSLECSQSDDLPFRAPYGSCFAHVLFSKRSTILPHALFLVRTHQSTFDLPHADCMKDLVFVSISPYPRTCAARMCCRQELLSMALSIKQSSESFVAPLSPTDALHFEILLAYEA